MGQGLADTTQTIVSGVGDAIGQVVKPIEDLRSAVSRGGIDPLVELFVPEGVKRAVDMSGREISDVLDVAAGEARRELSGENRARDEQRANDLIAAEEEKRQELIANEERIRTREDIMASNLARAARGSVASSSAGGRSTRSSASRGVVRPSTKLGTGRDILGL